MVNLITASLAIFAIVALIFALFITRKKDQHPKNFN